jgi:hypothetical protein
MNPYVLDVLWLVATVASVVLFMRGRLTAGWFAWGVTVGTQAVSAVLQDGWWGLLWTVLPIGVGILAARYMWRSRRELAELKAQFRENERRRHAAAQAIPNPREEQQ